MFKNKKGFTLAESISVLVILGVIAAITIPTLIMRQKEVAERAKLKKAWEVYDKAIATMRIDHPMISKEAFTQWANQANCPNTVVYFKAVDTDADNACIFKTADGIWFNISDILHPTITLDGHNNQNDDNIFSFVVSYDEKNLTFSVNNPTSQYLTNDEKEALKKLFLKLDVDISIREAVASKWINNFYSICYDWDYCNYYKNEYDSNQNLIVEYQDCDENGNNCGYSIKYEYDSNGNMIAIYFSCDENGNNCGFSQKYNYDSNGKLLVQYSGCDGNGNNCSHLDKYKYDSNGNIKYKYFGCDMPQNHCGLAKYEYDSDGNQIAYYTNCESGTCVSSYKNDYDSDGNQIAYYGGCDGNGNNCTYSYKYGYDNSGNKISESFCLSRENSCSSSYYNYEYDSNGNKLADYSGCNSSGNNCSSSNKYEYDSYGNNTAYYENCDGNGNNCEYTYTYSYTEIK